MDKLKKNWKVILICLLVAFSMNKCTTSCNRGNKISKLEQQIEQKDSIINAKDVQVNSLVRDTTDYLNRIRMYDKFGKQTDEYIRQKNTTDSINAINQAKQKAQTDALIKQNKQLIENAKKN